jgi:hypothetical protein
MHRREVHTRFWYEYLKNRDHFEGLNIDGNIILKWNVNVEDERVWPRFPWLLICTNGGLL